MVLGMAPLEIHADHYLNSWYSTIVVVKNAGFSRLSVTVGYQSGYSSFMNQYQPLCSRSLNIINHDWPLLIILVKTN